MNSAGDEQIQQNKPGTKNLRIVIAGGGTGGHIYPAIAIARAMEEVQAGSSISFVGSKSGLEKRIVPREGYPLHCIRVGKLNYQGAVFAKLKTLLGLPFAFSHCLYLLLRIRPHLVLGVGGFASGPFVLMAALLGYKTALWEPNAHPGLTNRILSRFTHLNLVVFDEARKLLNERRTILVGMPVRAELDSQTQMESRSRSIEGIESSEELSLDFVQEAMRAEDKDEKKSQKGEEAKLKVLVFGGSQGARAINQVLVSSLMSKPEAFHGVRILHQTGALDFESVSQQLKGKEGVEVREYLHEMRAAYLWADVILCRAGASTLAELASLRKPAILVPLPSAADNHQLVNARVLSEAGAAILLEQKDLSVESLTQLILQLKDDKEQLSQLAKNIGAFHHPGAAHQVAQKCLSLAM